MQGVLDTEARSGATASDEVLLHSMQQVGESSWENGTKRPNPRCERDIQSRESGSSKRGNRTSRHTDQHQESEEDEDAPASSNGGHDDEIEDDSTVSIDE
ncbi:hypothetical protein PHMEG_00015315 [Phytophthora megakarya]|uniref:Uncharacterized protein n=1 Tax=Phytophthora megakarya TaxID=4795 RepID=A0A225W1L6_9STRA|nr:hypothetical protein PHMEG_00015315 [Phytophthora megakarya]